MFLKMPERIQMVSETGQNTFQLIRYSLVRFQILKLNSRDGRMKFMNAFLVVQLQDGDMNKP
jgi:hypothetical protein